MKAVRPLILPILVLALGCSLSEIDSSELREFEFKGKPISAVAVHALLTEHSDLLPAVAAVDLEGFTESEVHNEKCEETGEWASYKPGENRYEIPGLFQYRHLGISKTGVHVLEWFDNGGGTLTVYGALLVRFEFDRVYDSGKWRQRIQMVSVGEVWDPDRTGTFKFDGRRLTGRESPDPDYRIDLIVE